MRNIFQLTKLEQRIVIGIVTLLVGIAFAKHFWQIKSQPPPTKSISTPAGSQTASPSKNEGESDDQR